MTETTQTGQESAPEAVSSYEGAGGRKIQTGEKSVLEAVFFCEGAGGSGGTAPEGSGWKVTEKQKRAGTRPAVLPCRYTGFPG